MKHRSVFTQFKMFTWLLESSNLSSLLNFKCNTVLLIVVKILTSQWNRDENRKQCSVKTTKKYSQNHWTDHLKIDKTCFIDVSMMFQYHFSWLFNIWNPTEMELINWGKAYKNKKTMTMWRIIPKYIEGKKMM